MSNLEPSATAYLRYVLSEMGISATELAKRAGIAATTLTRPLNDPAHKFTLTTKTIQKIAEASGINPGPFFSAPDIAALNLAPYFDPTFVDSDRWGPPNTDNKTTIVIGSAEPGVWREPAIADESDHGYLLLCSANYKAEECFGLIMRGRSMERVAADGDILFCVRLSASKRNPIAGDIVVIERKSDDGRLIEVSARVLAHGPKGPTLRFSTSDQKFSSAIPYPDASDPNTKVIAEVLYVVRDAVEK